MAFETLGRNGWWLPRLCAIGAVLLFGPIGIARAQTLPDGLQGDVGTGDFGAGALRGTDGADGSTSTLDNSTDAGATGAPVPNDVNAADSPPPAKLRSTVRPNWVAAVPPPRTGAPRLPELKPYLTANPKPRGTTVDAINVANNPPPPTPTTAALATEPPGRRPKPDATPFAPIGYTVGSLRLTPYVEQSIGFDSNPDQVETHPKPSAFSRTEGGFDLLSLWSSNELKATIHGGYNEYFSDPGANRPDGSGTVDYRYDVTRDLSFDTEGRFSLTTQRPGSPEVGVDLKDRPLVAGYGASLGGQDTLGRLTLSLHGTFDRSVYQNGRLPDGTVIVLDDANFNDYGLVAKAQYEVSPVFKPYVQVTADSRVHDHTIDISGYARDSDGVIGLLGAAFELTHLITGDIAVGYGDRTYQDHRLRDIDGPVVNASINYAVTPLTTLTLAASTSFDETTVAGSPGTQSRNVSLQVSHALLKNLTLTGILGYSNIDYVGVPISENSYSATVKATYNLSRSMLIDASYSHQSLVSKPATSSYDDDIFMLGLRIQH